MGKRGKPRDSRLSGGHARSVHGSGASDDVRGAAPPGPDPAGVGRRPGDGRVVGQGAAAGEFGQVAGAAGTLPGTGTRAPGTTPPATGGRAAARGRKPKKRRRGLRRKDEPVSLWRELPLLVVVAVILALVIKTFFVQAFYIPSGSMEQTIGVGDRVLVDKFTPWFGAKPERGEVVVFRDPGGWLSQEHKSDPPPVVKQLKQAMVFVGLLPSDDEQDLIKRVIGMGGDTVACCDASGRVTVNGVPLNEPYIHPGDAPSNVPFSVKVPEGRLWVMGDHRSDSADSRAHQDRPHQGTIAESDVIGRAFTVAWPVSRWRGLPVPGTFEGAGKFTNPGNATAVLPSAPVVMGVAGAVPVILLRRRVRSRPREGDPQARRTGTDACRRDEA